MIQARGLDTKIEIDGRISKENMRAYGKDVVDYFVTGSTVLSRNDLAGSLAQAQALREEIIKG